MLTPDVAADADCGPGAGVDVASRSAALVEVDASESTMVGKGCDAALRTATVHL